ncbi:MAG TPA: biopolymer transporter ExbD [Candidatus Hydrogenedentes bacterium]|nr:biopolymer transporter ExbD [Candidatus Hydrogenedentota bacterium]HPG68926.1 biopolymer transporter ExbD [Candidatus Hydrogenedentota bacterium]
MRFDSREKRKISASVDLTPLIDVVFQLLLFFMLSATFVVQQSIQIEVPEAEGSMALEQKDLSITVVYGEGGPENQGAVYVNETPVETWGELSRRLADAHAVRSDLLVLIRPDARVPTERLVKVLGIASSVGIEHYGIAAQPPAAPEE